MTELAGDVRDVDASDDETGATGPSAGPVGATGATGTNGATGAGGATLYNQTQSSSSTSTYSGSDNSQTLSGTIYGSLSGNCNPVGTTNPGACDTTVSTAGTVSNFSATISSNVNPDSIVFSVMKNGVATGITCTINSFNTSCTDNTLTNTVTTTGSETLVSNPHIVMGDATATTGGTAITLTGSSVFTNNNYTCSVNATNSTAAIEVSGETSSGFTLTSSTGSPTVEYVCVGN